MLFVDNFFMLRIKTAPPLKDGAVYFKAYFRFDPLRNYSDL